MKEFLTVREAVKFSGVPENTLRADIKSGKLPAKNTYRDGVSCGSKRGMHLEMIAVAVNDLNAYVQAKILQKGKQGAMS